MTGRKSWRKTVEGKWVFVTFSNDTFDLGEKVVV